MQLKLSDNIKKYRKKMDLTQEGLADALGVTVGAVSKWENGNNVPDVMTMMELADFFSISMDELLGFSLSSKKIDDMCNEIDILARHHQFDEAGIGENIFTGVKYNYCRKEKIKAYDTTGTKAIDSIGKMIEKKLEDTSGKNKEKIQRVLDSWERLCSARAII